MNPGAGGGDFGSNLRKADVEDDKSSSCLLIIVIIIIIIIIIYTFV